VTFSVADDKYTLIACYGNSTKLYFKNLGQMTLSEPLTNS